MQYQDMGDLIGAESCVEFGPNATATLSHGGASGPKIPRWQRRSIAAAKQFPPVIPSLSRTITKYSTDDGRLVIMEDKLRCRRREYLEAHRSNGRLVLNLVPLDGGDDENVEVSDEVVNEPAEVHSEKGKYDGIGGCAAAVAVAVAELRPPVFTGKTF